jgi:RNA polymerase sigma-70 factor, ECF subfamily
MEETELVRLLKNGDENAYRLIVEKYQTIVLNCCFRFVRNREIAEDLTQEVFIEVHRSVKYFNQQSSFLTWLYRIAITKSLDHLKGLKRKKRSGFLKRIYSDDGTAENIFTSSLPDPHQLLENEERIKVLSWALESLPENQKVAFTLSKYDELSYKEIADILETTIPSIESLIFRAKLNLKKKLHRFYKEHV